MTSSELRRISSGHLWIASSHAVLRVDRARLLSGKLSDGDVREFGVSDGLLDSNGVRRERCIVLDPSGRIWISRNEGIGVLDPERLRRIAAPTIVHIERLLSTATLATFAHPCAYPQIQDALSWNMRD